MPTMPASGQIATGVSIAGSGIAAAASAGLLSTIGLTAAAVPIIGPVVAGITAIIGVLGIGNGCGQTCTASTQVVNYWEPYLQQNLQAAKDQAQANGGCLTSAEKQQLEGLFDQIWQNVVTQCHQIPAPGGTQCISDRQQGSTKIGGGSWFTLYRDPISAMPVCTPTVTNDLSNMFSSSVSGGSSLLLPLLGVALIGFALFGGDK